MTPPQKARVTQLLVPRSLGVGQSEMTLNDQFLYTFMKGLLQNNLVQRKTGVQPFWLLLSTVTTTWKHCSVKAKQHHPRTCTREKKERERAGVWRSHHLQAWQQDLCNLGWGGGHRADPLGGGGNSKEVVGEILRAPNLLVLVHSCLYLPRYLPWDGEFHNERCNVVDHGTL